MEKFSKWVACWGNATSITDRTEATYAKDITLRYPVRMCFNGSKLRMRFSNLTGTEAVELTEVFVSKDDVFVPVTFDEERKGIIQPGQEVTSDEIEFDITAGEEIAVSIYLGNYTQMNAGTLITGPLSGGYYSYGRFANKRELPVDLTRNTNWYYFLNTIDIFTEEKNHALICYGDSITAQSWPDYLAIRAWNEGYKDVSVIRRAVSGTRILRQYDCITYQAYGLKGETRFPIESNVAGARDIIIQHGINDIIHPVGGEVNQFRPWSDMPTAKEMENAVKDLYIIPSKEMGLKVWGGTLLPIKGWRTYADFRDELRMEFNKWILSEKDFDGSIDFDAAVRDEEDKAKFGDGNDSGDHLHPSEKAYELMANAVPAEILQ